LTDNLPELAGAPTLLSLIARAAADPAIDIEKMRALLDMHHGLAADQARIAYNQAMNLAQAEITPVARTTENTQTRSFYAKLEEVDAAIRPIYLKHGFSISDNTVAPLTPGYIRVECICSHNAGHSERFYREAPADTLGPKGAPVKTQLHGEGSTETFLKRYIRCGIFNVVFKGRDDDGVRGGMTFISAADVALIETLIKESGSDRLRFLQYMGVDEVENIQARDKDSALVALMRKSGRGERGGGPVESPAAAAANTDARRAAVDDPAAETLGGDIDPAEEAGSAGEANVRGSAPSAARPSGPVRQEIRANQGAPGEMGGSPATDREILPGKLNGEPDYRGWRVKFDKAMNECRDRAELAKLIGDNYHETERYNVTFPRFAAGFAAARTKRMEGLPDARDDSNDPA
jgi:ERF superfamily